MLEHLNSSLQKPKRVVVMGSGSFVGGAIIARLAQEGVAVLPLSRKEVNLLEEKADKKLSSLLKPGDSFVAVSAIAPVKNTDMLLDNMVMVRAMATALAGAELAHVVNISSDAIYADGPVPLSERTPAAPTSLHGAMHLARELVFRAEVKAPLAMLRPTLIYGKKDPHNGYGPNRFRRLAAEGKEIVLFGEGEERRDHVLIDDVAEIAFRVLMRKSTGELNVATGQVHSFMDLAKKISAKRVEIKTTKRAGPMPHNGYRPFDVAAVARAFPDFRFTSLEKGLELANG